MSQKNAYTPEEVLRAMQALSQELIDLEKLNLAHMTLWEVAVKTQNGKEETTQRELLHNILDQGCDIRMRALQLTKDFMSR